MAVRSRKGIRPEGLPPTEGSFTNQILENYKYNNKIPLNGDGKPKRNT